MEKLHGYAVLVYYNPESALANFFKGHVGQRTGFFVAYGGGLGKLLEVVPKCAPAQPNRHGGEAAHSHIEGGLQHRPVYGLAQGGRKPEKVVPVPAPGGGVYLCRVVQTHPA